MIWCIVTVVGARNKPILLMAGMRGAHMEPRKKKAPPESGACDLVSQGLRKSIVAAWAREEDTPSASGLQSREEERLLPDVAERLI